MPNWCVTNWAIRGPKEKIDTFVNLVNDLPNREDVAENGVGKYWLANLAVALGCDLEQLRDKGANLRGTIEEDDGLTASLAFPGKDADEEHDKVESHFLTESDLYICYFSTVSAWGMPDWLVDWFKEHDYEYGYKTTDEFRNFNALHNLDLFPYIYEAVGEDICDEFKLGQEREIGELLQKAGVPINVQNIHDKDTLCDELNEHEEEMREKECWVWIYDVE